MPELESSTHEPDAPSTLPTLELASEEPEPRLPSFLQSRHRHMLVIALVAIVLAFVLRVRADQRVHVVGLTELPVPPTCASKSWFDVPCPGCGLTRSFIALASGNVFGSWTYHRIGVILALIMLLQIPYRLYALSTGTDRPLGSVFPKIVCWVLIFLLLANWVANIAVLGFPTNL